MKQISLFLTTIIFLSTVLSASEGATVYMINAINKRDLATVQAMLVANPSLAKAVNKNGESVLHAAAGSGDMRIIKLILQYKPNVNAKDKAGRQPIFIACENSFLDNMTLLLNAGADPNASDATGMTPLLIVSMKGKPKMAKALINAGAKANTANKNGTTALMYAAENGNQDLVRTLLAAGCKANAIDKQGNCVLHYAARNDRRNMIKMFPQLINVKNKAGQTPLNIAMLSGKSKFAQELQKYGAQLGN